VYVNAFASSECRDSVFIFTQPAFQGLSSGFVFADVQQAVVPPAFLLFPPPAYSSPIRFRASSVRADGVRTCIVDFTAGVSPAGGFRYPAIAVQLVEPGVRIRLQHTAEPARWVCGWMPFLSGL
jgi:hypothetical protein